MISAMLRNRTAVLANARCFSSGVVARQAMPAASTAMTKTAGIAPSFNQNPLTSQVGIRHGGVSVLGCAIAMVGVGGCAQGMGTLFAGLVVGMARNPSMKGELFTYTLIGLGFVELLAFVVIGAAGLCYVSE